MKKSRRFLSVLLAVLMVLSMTAVSVSAYTVPDGFAVADVPGLDETSIDGEVYGLLGDADFNDTVNVKDATAIQKNAAGLQELDAIATVLADVDFDGRVTVKDATAVQKWVAGIEVDTPINHIIYIPATAPTEIPTEIPTEATTAAPTEATTETPFEGITLYFTNNKNWDKVMIHYWNLAGGTTKWPGVEMTLVGQNDLGEDIYSYTITEGVDGVIFNNGAETPEQTQNIETGLTDGTGFYLTDEVDELGHYAVGTYEYKPSTPTEATTAAPTEATTEAATEPTGTKTVYFKNEWMWTEVSAYYWAEGSSGPVKWPGTAMTFVETGDDNYDVYKIEVPAGMDTIIFNGLKDDGSGNRNQTPNIADILDGYCYYPVWDETLNEGAGGNSYGKFPYTEPQPTTGAETTAPVETTAEPTETTAAAGTVVITLKDKTTTGWMSNNAAEREIQLVDNVTGTVYVMTSADNYKTWSVEVPAEVTDITFNRVRISDGEVRNAWVAGDRGTSTVWCVTDNVDNNPAGYWETSAEPTEATTEAPTDPSGAKTVYFKNEWMWTEVSAYYWAEGSSGPVKWPGTAMTFVETGDDSYDV
ncbi:MAG: starch-binding protein, partial [Ruminococcus sp.]